MDPILNWLNQYLEKPVTYTTCFEHLNWQIFDEAAALDWCHKTYGIPPYKYSQDTWFHNVHDFVDWVQVNK